MENASQEKEMFLNPFLCVFCAPCRQIQRIELGGQNGVTSTIFPHNTSSGENWHLILPCLLIFLQQIRSEWQNLTVFLLARFQDRKKPSCKAIQLRKLEEGLHIYVCGVMQPPFWPISLCICDQEQTHD